MAFPRACALAEVTWSPATARNWGDFQRRLRIHTQRLGQFGINYRPLTPSAP
jgi:hexosaminidase